MLNNLYTKIEACLHIRSELALHSLIIPGMWENCLGSVPIQQACCFSTQAGSKLGVGLVLDQSTPLILRTSWGANHHLARYTEQRYSEGAQKQN